MQWRIFEKMVLVYVGGYLPGFSYLFRTFSGRNTVSIHFEYQCLVECIFWLGQQSELGHRNEWKSPHSSNKNRNTNVCLNLLHLM